MDFEWIIREDSIIAYVVETRARALFYETHGLVIVGRHVRVPRIQSHPRMADTINCHFCFRRKYDVIRAEYTGSSKCGADNNIILLSLVIIS